VAENAGNAAKADDRTEITGPPVTTRLIGHSAAASAFVDAVASDRLHHAWLLTGPKGVGKASFAWLAAKVLIAHSTAGPSLFGDSVPPSFSADADDPVARRIAEGAHGNIRVISPEIDPKTGAQKKETTIAPVRALIPFFAQTASEEGDRVCIIDAADNLNVSAANALLKLLEEPPENTVFLLISHNPGRLLPTIRSRCRQLRFGRLSADELDAVARLVGKDTEHPNWPLASALSEGRAGAVFDLLDGDGITDLNALGAVLQSRNIRDMHRFAEQMASPKALGRHQNCADLLRQSLEQGISGRLAALHPLSAPFQALIARRGIEESAQLCQKVAQQAAQATGLNLDRKLFWILTLTSLATA